ncbi:MAG: hypothetical protein AAB911_02410 [Patescibacteria group bacterium]
MQFEVKIKINKKLYSREHLLADDLSQAMLETKNFAAYLGIARIYHEEDLRALAKRVAARKGLPVEARGKYFFAALKGLNKKIKENVKNRNGKIKSSIKK